MRPGILSIGSLTFAASNRMEFMSISAVTSAFAAHAQQVVSGTSTPADPNSAKALAQEATETQAQTLKEAQNNDPVAKRKLAKLQAQHQQQQAPAAKASEPGKGTSVDHVA